MLSGVAHGDQSHCLPAVAWPKRGLVAQDGTILFVDEGFPHGAQPRVIGRDVGVKRERRRAVARERWSELRPSRHDVVDRLADGAVDSMRLVEREPIGEDNLRGEARAVDRDDDAPIEDIRLENVDRDGRLRGDVGRGEVAPRKDIGQIRRGGRVAQRPLVANDGIVVRLVEAVPRARDALRPCAQLRWRAVVTTLPAAHVQIDDRGWRQVGNVPRARGANHGGARVHVHRFRRDARAPAGAVEREDTRAVVEPMLQCEAVELNHRLRAASESAIARHVGLAEGARMGRLRKRPRRRAPLLHTHLAPDDARLLVENALPTHSEMRRVRLEAMDVGRPVGRPRVTAHQRARRQVRPRRARLGTERRERARDVGWGGVVSKRFRPRGGGQAGAVRRDQLHLVPRASDEAGAAVV